LALALDRVHHHARRRGVIATRDREPIHRREDLAEPVAAEHPMPRRDRELEVISER
jgi:hypothetical protein